jgi:hypothetical protein
VSRRITEEQQRSNARVAYVRSGVTVALAKVGERHPDLTYEEILDALLMVAQRQVMRLRSEEGSHDPTDL